MANPIVHFEIPADDTHRAKEFYTKTFGWKIDEWKDPAGTMEYFAVHTKTDGAGIDGGMMKRKHKEQPFMNYVAVASIDKMLKAVVANGGTVALPKTEIAPGMGWIAAFIDTERNIIGLHENAPKH